MFEPMAMNQQQFGAMPSARRESTSQAVASALVNALGKKKETPPPDSTLGGTPPAPPENTTETGMELPRTRDMSGVSTAEPGKYEAPAPSQIDTRPYDAVMDQKPETQFSSSENPFQAAAMADQFGQWGTPEARDHAQGAQEALSVLAAMYGGG